MTGRSKKGVDKNEPLSISLASTLILPMQVQCISLYFIFFNFFFFGGEGGRGKGGGEGGRGKGGGEGGLPFRPDITVMVDWA